MEQVTAIPRERALLPLYPYSILAQHHGVETCRQCWSKAYSEINWWWRSPRQITVEWSEEITFRGGLERWRRA